MGHCPWSFTRINAKTGRFLGLVETVTSRWWALPDLHQDFLPSGGAA